MHGSNPSKAPVVRTEVFRGFPECTPAYFGMTRRARDFSRHHIHTGSGAYHASCPICTGDSYPEGKAAGALSWSLTSI